MHPASRLAIKNASARRSRTALLIGAVALSAAMIVAVASALNSLNASVDLRTRATLGAGDLRIEPTGSGQTLDQALVQTVSAWPEATLVAPRLEAAVTTLAVVKPIYKRQADGSWTRHDEFLSSPALGNGIVPQIEVIVRPIQLLAGRLPQGPDEVVIDALLAERLGWAWQQSPDRRYGFGLATRATVQDRLSPLPTPSSPVTASQAQHYNERQGARPGDVLQAMPSFLASNLLAIGGTIPGSLSGPNIIVNLMGNFRTPSGTSSYAEIATLITNPRRIFDEWRNLRDPIRLTIVGIAAQPPLGGRPQCFMTIDTLQRIGGLDGRLSQIDVMLDDQADPETVANLRRSELPEGVILQTTERITSGLDQNLKSSRLGFLLASVLTLMSAAFIIMTGLTTDIAQRQRELAILRCVGGTRGVLARIQIVTGLIIGGGGAIVGVPAGLFMAWMVARAFPDQIPSGLVVPIWGVVMALAGSVVAGLLGAGFPAWQAARMSPLKGLAARAVPAQRRGIVIVLIAGLAGVMTHLAVVFLAPNGQVAFWLYVLVGLPALFVGYFLLSVPILLALARVLAPSITRILRLPSSMLARGLARTPYRYGLTAGAMMTGLALMVAIWTNGTAILRDYIDKMEFPDAFVSGIPLAPGAKPALDALPFVDNSCAITKEIVQVGADAQVGVRGLQRYDTSFIGFEPEPFFDMTNITFVQGTRDEAIRRLNQGGAVMIAREFMVARGVTVGDTFHCSKNGKEFEFEIVAVVTSPGLEIASRFFNIGKEYTHQAVHAVFGSMGDVRTKLGSDKIHLIQIDLDDSIDDATAIRVIRQALAPYGLLDAGSGRQIKEQVHTFVRGTLLVFSSVAVMAMLVACFGVANLIIAGIRARRFEFGVLRAVGGQRALIVRLVLAEALVVAITAAVVGTVMGTQAAIGGRKLYQLLLGIQFDIRPPLEPISIGWVIVIILTVLAAIPAIWSLNRKRPRELLAAISG